MKLIETEKMPMMKSRKQMQKQMILMQMTTIKMLKRWMVRKR